MWRWLFAGARMTVRDKQPLEQMLAGCAHASLVPTRLLARLLANRAAVTLKAVLLGGAVIPVELTDGPAGWGSLLVRVWAHGFASGNGKEADGSDDVDAPLTGRIRIVDNEVCLRAAGMAERFTGVMAS